MLCLLCCAVCSVFDVFFYSLDSFFSLNSIVGLALLPSGAAAFSSRMCVHILRFLVCGKRFLLCLCVVVVECSLLRVRIIYYNACSNVDGLCLLLLGIHVSTIAEYIGRFMYIRIFMLITNVWECWIVIAFNKFRNNLFSHFEYMTSFIAPQTTIGLNRTCVSNEFKRKICASILLWSTLRFMMARAYFSGERSLDIIFDHHTFQVFASDSIRDNLRCRPRTAQKKREYNISKWKQKKHHKNTLQFFLQSIYCENHIWLRKGHLLKCRLLCR